MRARLKKNIVEDFEGYLWVVKDTQATTRGFTVLRGVREEDIHQLVSSRIILTPRLVQYIRKNPIYEVGVLPMARPTFNAIAQRLKARPIVTDIHQEDWEVLEEKSTTLGFPVLYGHVYPSRAHCNGLTVILTRELYDYLKAHRDAGLPIGKTGLPLMPKRIRSLYIRAGFLSQLEVVKDAEGKRYYVHDRKLTAHGFEILRGALMNKTGRQNHHVVIPTPALIEYIRANPVYTKANLPEISEPIFTRIARHFNLTQEIRDIHGKVWHVQREKPTKHGFSIYYGRRKGEVCRSDGTPTMLTIPTRALIDFIKKHLALGAPLSMMGLPMTMDSLEGLIKRVGIKSAGTNTVKDKDGKVWTVYARAPSGHGFDLIKGIPEGDWGVRAVVVPTREVVTFIEQHIKSGLLLSHIDLPIQLPALKRLMARGGIQDAAPPKVKDVEGREWFAYQRHVSALGVEILRGRLVEQTRGGECVIPTPELVNFLKTHKGRLPVALGIGHGVARKLRLLPQGDSKKKPKPKKTATKTAKKAIEVLAKMPAKKITKKIAKKVVKKVAKKAAKKGAKKVATKTAKKAVKKRVTV